MLPNKWRTHCIRLDFSVGARLIFIKVYFVLQMTKIKYTVRIKFGKEVNEIKDRKLVIYFKSLTDVLRNDINPSLLHPDMGKLQGSLGS